ncbi:unnamed protein product, partial [Brassica oleracea var. botrytis]
VKEINGLEKIIIRDRHGQSFEAIFKPPKAIRGGIPVLFPQYSNTGLLFPHMDLLEIGFGRLRLILFLYHRHIILLVLSSTSS